LVPSLSATSTSASAPAIAAYAHELRTFAIDSDFELMLVARRARGLDTDVVFAIEGEIAMDRDASARAER
jgi:hypothetical protein